MEDRDLFLAVVVDGSFVAASRRLGISRSTLSRRMRRLEIEVDLPLFHRTGKVVQLTALGRQYADELGVNRRRRDTLEQRLRDRRGALRGTVCLSVPVSGMGTWLGQLCAAFRTTHTEIALRVDVGADLRRWTPGAFDVGLQFGMRMNPSLVYRRLYDERSVLVASPAYVEANGLPASIAELVDHHAIMERDPSGRPIPWRLPDGRRVASPPTALDTNATDLAIDAALRGVGICRAPSLLVREALARGSLVEVLPDVHAFEAVGLVYLPEPPAPTAAFVGFVAQQRFGVD